jgi:hypothetical protein
MLLVTVVPALKLRSGDGSVSIELWHEKHVGEAVYFDGLLNDSTAADSLAGSL